jgi:hypothetical protein
MGRHLGGGGMRIRTVALALIVLLAACEAPTKIPERYVTRVTEYRNELQLDYVYLFCAGDHMFAMTSSGSITFVGDCPR